MSYIICKHVNTSAARIKLHTSGSVLKKLGVDTDTFATEQDAAKVLSRIVKSTKSSASDYGILSEEEYY